ncbi:activator of Hsp90 ATPase 1 family protein [Arthrobacter crystallopoietes BAB-32]|uniref:Activator of Hsp90 ATPase 1 family protein n=1 Tax=Arthrobacter crystallopoietes BAB-32 TaxID=1246476 RepID=N1UZR1_9MICC|nr:SRPBCC family protein [Arthrobacter crystallopoietes]EMY34560.1 activator of Hsp90 ATPase 1 family protein [Arthrobacter crystallopoietes BAB-32]
MSGAFRIDVSLDSTIEGASMLRFRCRFAHSLPRVWQALTDDEQLSAWFPCRVRLEERAGGRIEFLFPDQEPDYGEVLEFEPESRLGFSWDQEVLHWYLHPDADGCRLMMTNTLQDPESRAKVAAGWHGCFQALDALLSGSEAQLTPLPELIEHYRQTLG